MDSESLGSFDWEVEPASRKAALGSARAKGVLRIESEAGGRETIALPASLARRLASDKKSGKLDPASRAELLYEVGRASREIAWTRLCGLLERRDYAAAEATRKLREDGFTPRVATESVERARQAGLIDDARFADVYIRGKLSQGWGARRIERELSQRGIDVTEVPGWPYEYLDPGDELERAREVARRKVVRGPNQLQKLARFLVGRGYSLGVAFEAARRELDERSEEEG